MAKRFVEREGLYYTAAQVKEYDISREKNKEIKQALLFISTQEEGVAWLQLKLSDTQILHKQQDLQTEWMQLLSPRKNEVIRELSEILADFFIPAPGAGSGGTLRQNRPLGATANAWKGSRRILRKRSKR